MCLHARAQTLPGLLRHKAYRKRTAGRARWHFPGGFQLAVAYYALLQPAYKGAPVFLNAASNEPLKVESALICQDTGGAQARPLAPLLCIMPAWQLSGAPKGRVVRCALCAHGDYGAFSASESGRRHVFLAEREGVGFAWRWGACSGAVLTDVPKRMFPKRDLAAKLGERFPPVFFNTEELRDVKAVKEAGVVPSGLWNNMCPCTFAGERNGAWACMERHYG